MRHFIYLFILLIQQKPIQHSPLFSKKEEKKNNRLSHFQPLSFPLLFLCHASAGHWPPPAIFVPFSPHPAPTSVFLSIFRPPVLSTNTSTFRHRHHS